MTNSDRYSPDDYNADQIDEDAIEQQGAVKTKAGTKRDTDKRKVSTSGPKPGTVATRAKRTDSDQDGKKVGAKATAKSASANGAKNSVAKKPAKKAVKKSATNRVGKAALSKEATMKAMAK